MNNPHLRRLAPVPAALLAALALVGPAAPAEAARRDGAEANVAAGVADSLLDDLGEIPALMAGARWNARRGTYVSTLKDGREAELTLDHELQTQTEELLANYKVPYAAVVALDPRDGRILAMAESADKVGNQGSQTKAIFPAASVFKIVTGAALLESGISPETEVCFHGGMHSIDRRQLQDDPRRDRVCATLGTAMAKSLNVVFGKLASRRLNADVLRAMAGRFFFNQPLPIFPSSSSVGDALVSRAVIPEDALGFGRTAAGFGQVYLSPLHGAMLAAAVGNRGLAVEPHLVEAVVRGGVRASPPPAHEQRIVSEATSALLTRMMERTVSEGTARKAFRGRRGKSALGAIVVAGKTGSLADHPPLPFKDYSWFVGFAPAEDPKVAVAAVVVNGPKWKVKAPFLAREALRSFFDADLAKLRHASR